MKTTTLFQIDGKPMLVPDAEMGFSYEDLDASDSGRDESGVMHRFPVRYKVGSWSFQYSALTDEEYAYLEGLFGTAATFRFTHPDRLDASKSVTTKAYRSKYSISWYNARTGMWRNLKFNIIEC